MDNFSLWFNEAKFTPSDEVFDVGRTAIRALRNYSQNDDPLKSGLDSLNDNGNG